jgi:serine O-acetyltransferase
MSEEIHAEMPDVEHSQTMGLRDLIDADLARFTETYVLRGQPFSRRRVFWESVLFKAGFQAVLLYRLSHWLFQRGSIYLPWFLSRLSIALTGADIEFNAQIGPGLFIAHPVGIVVGRGTVIGDNATLFQGVTFGVKSWHAQNIREFPRVGSKCYFFAHAAIIGNINSGNNCIVGANAVVTTDVPDGALAVGVPARNYENKGSEAIRSWSI